MRLVLCLLLLLAGPAFGQVLDGNPSELPLADDDAADGGLLTVRAQAWADGLWIGLEFDGEVAATSGSGLVLHVDTDGDGSTGDSDGCEFVFDLQARHGSLHPDRELPGAGRMFHRLGVAMAPAFRATTAELRIPRTIRGGDSIFAGPRARCFVVFDGDRAPDRGYIELEWSEQPVPVERIAVSRAGGLRVASWNIEKDGLFDEERFEAQSRLLRALDADVLVVNESFRYGADEVFARVQPLGLFEHAAKADPGNVVLSRYPILETWPIIDGPERWNGHRVSAVVVDTPSGPFLLLPQHWRCCKKEGQRLFEADAVVGFLRDAFTEGGNFTFDEELPFVVLGDLNLVTTRRPLDVVLTGVVVDKDSFGPDFPPGPQRTPLSVVPVRHSDAPFTHTYRPRDTSKYYPARLDWALVPSSVSVLRAFVLDSGTMFGTTLEELGLQRRDSRIASDHMPVVVDVSFD